MKLVKLLSLTLGLGTLIIPTVNKNILDNSWSDFELISEMKQDNKNVSNTASTYVESKEMFAFDIATEKVNSGQTYEKIFGENNEFTATVIFSGNFTLKDGVVQGKGNGNQKGDITMEVSTNCPNIRRIAMHCNANEVKNPPIIKMGEEVIPFDTQARGGKFYSKPLESHENGIKFTATASWDKKEGIGFTGFSFCDAVEYSFSESNTTYSLRYDYEKIEDESGKEEYSFKNIQLRFGGLAKSEEWDAAKKHIKSYGVMAAITDNLDKKSIKIAETGVQEVKASGNEPYRLVQNDTEYVLFNGYINVSMTHISTKITALAFFDDENGDRFFFDELNMCAQDVAKEYQNMDFGDADYIGSLNAFIEAK